MSIAPIRGPVQRPSDDRDFTEIFGRLNDLERTPPGSGGIRQVYGRIYDDGATLDAGSGDWTATTSGWIEVTIDPPFTVGFECNVTPNDNGDSLSYPVDLQPATSVPNSYSGFVQVIQIDLGTFAIMFWDLDGNPMVNRCGFDFLAVGT